jgi:hypothetical protein
MEIWKDIPELGGKYQCSNYGRIRRVNKDSRCVKHKLLKTQKNRTGYVYVNPTTTYRKLVHRIVAQLFLDNPDGKVIVNHKDLNKLNNHVDNLEWVTNSENSKHANDNGRLGRMHLTVIDNSTGIVYRSLIDACRSIGLPYKYTALNLKKLGTYKNLSVVEKTYKNIF